MKKPPRSIRMALATVAATAMATITLVIGPVASASAATATYLTMHPSVANPIAGQQITMQVFTGSLDGTFPAGEAEVMVEGTGMMIGLPVSTTNGGAVFTIGNFPIGTITVDATFVPTNSATYAPTTTKVAVSVVGASLSVHPLIPTAPALGHTTSASILMSIGSGNTRAPGGTVSFIANGKAVGSCVPAPTSLASNFSCSTTLPAPTAAGSYTITSAFSGSTYYSPASGSQTFTVAALPKAAPAKPAPVNAPAPATSSPPAGTTPTPTATGTAAPRIANAHTADSRTVAPTGTGPWPWLFLVALLLLIGAVVAVVVLLRRRGAVS